MKHALLVTTVIVTAFLGASAAAQAEEPNGPPPPHAAERAAPPPVNPDFGHDFGPDLGPDLGPNPGLARGPEHGPDRRPLPPHMRGMPGRPDVLGLATRLSAAEIYLGITPEQLGPWRAYTTALIDLVSPVAEQNPPPPPPVPGDSKARPEPRLAGEELAGDIVRRAEKAKVLQDAAAALKPKLLPQQVLKLAELERALMPPPPPGPRHGPAERDRLAPPHDAMRPPVPEADRG